MSNNDINESNIFKELSWDLDFWDIKEESKNEEIIKDSIYYMNLSKKSLFFLNIALLFILVLTFSYVSIQKNEDMLNNSLLNPFCSVLLGWEISSKVNWDCSSVYSLYNEYSTKNETLKTSFTNTIAAILPALYSVENFTLSKDVKFIIEKTDSKIKPLDILSTFDKLKNSFVAWDKWQLTCSNLEIDSQNNFSISCTAYTSDWSDSIPSSDPGKKISWTSISLASSFISYIEKNSKEFEILDKPKTFSREDYTWVWYYTKKTDFNLKLKYYKNNTNNF